MEDGITVNGVEYVRADSQATACYNGLPYVIVRATGAGVHAGFLVEQTDNTVRLANSRRLWRWHGRTLSGLALEGPDDLGKCKFGDVLHAITIAGWCEIIPCTKDAMEMIGRVARWKND